MTAPTYATGLGTARDMTYTATAETLNTAALIRKDRGIMQIDQKA
ncbi:MAG: hypothetical protein ACR2N9_06155 [Acidimicrobiia bacterium]